ncbi:autotransporter domain-containing protein [Bradyrhizobium sp. UFLA05-153]
MDAAATAAQRLRCRATVWAAVMGVLIAFLSASPGSAQVRGQNTPTIDKSFGASEITVGSSTTLTFTVTGATLGNTGVNFTDALPSGLVVATPTGLTVTGADASCNASNVTATAGAASISLANVSLASNQTCTVAVNVTATATGQKNNSVKVSSDQGPGNNATAHLTVDAAPTPSPPAIAKSFAPSSIPLGGTSVLTFTITNPNASAALAGVAFSDTLPAGLTVPAASIAQCGGTLTTTATSIALAGASIAGGGVCSFSVTVTATTSGTKVNNSSAVTSTNGGTGNTASASLEVTALAPPGISKSFAPASIAVNGTSSLTFTITNPNASTALTGVAFTDAFPAGLLVATPSGLTNACGGTLTAPAGGSSVNLSGATLAAASSCTISLNVTGTTTGIKVNSTSPVSSTNGGTGDNASAALAVGVTSPPAIAKSFAPSLIPLGGTSVLTFTIINPNPVLVLSGVAFTDALPAGLTVPAASIAQCGGTLTTTGTSIALAGANITGGGACTFSLIVTGTTTGTKVNTTSNVTSSNGGTGNTASSSLQVTALAPPGLSKSFAPASIVVGGTSLLTFTISNPNASTALSGVAFTDAFPAGLLVASPSGLTNSCGGTLTAPAGGGSINLSGATLAAASSCTISINVTGTTAGIKVNASSPISSTNGGAGDSASATLTVNTSLSPSVQKVFGAASIATGGVTSLTFTVVNPNPSSALTGVALTDRFPAGLVVASPNGLTGSCGGGSITATAGGGNVSLTGATLPAAASCTFSVNVTGTTVGSLTNVTDPVTSTNGGTGNTASASITISVPADSGRLRDLQLTVTKIEAHASGAAVSGAVDEAIADGFTDCAGPQVPVKASGGGLRFKFGCELQPPPTKGTPSVVLAPPLWLAWADIRGSDWNTSQQTGDIRGGQINALFGISHRLTTDILIGAFGGYENFDYTSQLLDGRLKGDGWTAGGYFGWRFLPGMRFDASLARSGISYSGVAGTAFATFPGQRWLATASLIGVYKTHYGVEIEPSLKVYALWEREDAYTDNFGVTESSRSFSEGRASAGAKIMYPWLWTTTVKLTPYVGLYADYYFNRDDATLPVGPLLQPTQFLQGWSARVTTGVGVTLGAGPRFSVDGELGGLGSNQFTVWSVRGRASVPFSAD